MSYILGEIGTKTMDHDTTEQNWTWVGPSNYLDPTQRNPTHKPQVK